MNIVLKRAFTFVLAILLCLGVCACGGGDGSVVDMNYDTGIDQFGRYNSALYGNNGISDPEGADPGVFYVSEEEDAEYGGYFYRYTTSETTLIPDTEYYQSNFVKILVAYCDRSRDLYHWESAGALAGGYSLAIDSDSWCNDNFWAPEVIRNPSDGKYYMYFSAAARTDLGVSYISSSEEYTDRLYIGVAVADAPVGPFTLLGNVDEETGKLVPTINFQTGFGIDYHISAIDAHPFFDDDGQLYLYFVRHGDAHWDKGNHPSGMKMKTMTEPDYTTAVVLAAPGAVAVNATAGNAFVFERGEDYFIGEGLVNEGPFMYKYNGKYYLTYSANGYGDPGYSVHQAVSDSPLGPFIKLGQSEGNPVLDGSLFGDVQGTGHHAFVTVGDELFIVYHRHGSIIDGLAWGRPTAVDRVSFVSNSNGLEVMSANGPSRVLTWLPESVSGYQNLTQSATITADNGTGVMHLSDGSLAMYDVNKDAVLSAKSGDVTITLRWQEPVSVSSVMVYNSAKPESAFSKISSMRFKLAEKPAWAKYDYDWAVAQDVPLQYGAWNPDTEKYLEGAPAVAEFDPIMVTEIQITIQEADRLMEYGKMGERNTTLNVSEIVVLGGTVTNE